MNINIEQMTIEQKIKTMEMLWDDLCKEETVMQIPGWHKDILYERERGLKEGKDKFIDWNIAKKELLELIS